MKHSGVILYLALTSSVSAGTTGLSGPPRNAFVEDAFQVCLQKMQANAGDLKLAKLAQYCVCYSNHLADRVSPEDNRALNELFVQDKAQLAAKLRPILHGIADDCAHALTP